MLRSTLTVILPFLTPFICYAVYAWFLARQREKLDHGEAVPAWQNWPWAWLVIAGGALGGIAFAALFIAGPGLPEKNQRWVAPAVIDGKVVPGHFETVPPPKDED